MPIWKIRSGCANPFSTYSPRSTHFVSSSSACVTADTRTCPPCPVSMIRAVPIQRRAEEVTVTLLGLAGVEAHANRQIQGRLRLDRSGDGPGPRLEHCTHAVARALEHPTTASFDAALEHRLMRSECHCHAIGIVLPPLRRRLDIREQERQRPTRYDPHRASLAQVIRG